MAIELTKEQMKKVVQVHRILNASGLPKSIVQHRVNNYRRTLALDMESYKRRPVKFSDGNSRRKELIAAGKIPATVTPNVKASKRLDIRIRAFEGMKATEQAAHTRPGSLSK